MKARVKQDIECNIEHHLGVDGTLFFNPSMKYTNSIDVFPCNEFCTERCLKTHKVWFTNGGYRYHKSWLIFEDPKLEKLINGNNHESKN